MKRAQSIAPLAAAEITPTYNGYRNYRRLLTGLAALLLAGCQAGATPDQVAVSRPGLKAVVDDSCHQRMRLLSGFKPNQLTEDEVVEQRRFRRDGWDAQFERCRQARYRWLQLSP